MTDLRARWASDLLSTAAADRSAAEAGLRTIYAAAEMEAPQHFFWFPSPFRAAGAAALLIAGTDTIWNRIIRAMDRMKEEHAWLEGLREDIYRMSGLAGWPSVIKAAGLSLSPAQARTGGPKGLYPAISLARMALNKGAAASAPPVNDSDPLYNAERSYRAVIGGQEQWSIINPMLMQSFYQFVLYSGLAKDEEALNGQAPPSLLAALWSVARSAGVWWPFVNAVVISDRPSEIHVDAQWRLHNGDGPAIIFRDGERAWAWEGRAMREEWILHPEEIPPREFKQFEKSFRDYMSPRIGAADAKPGARESRR